MAEGEKDKTLTPISADYDSNRAFVERRKGLLPTPSLADRNIVGKTAGPVLPHIPTNYMY
jgi:hypothetical protein